MNSSLQNIVRSLSVFFVAFFYYYFFCGLRRHAAAAAALCSGAHCTRTKNISFLVSANMTHIHRYHWRWGDSTMNKHSTLNAQWILYMEATDGVARRWTTSRWPRDGCEIRRWMAKLWKRDFCRCLDRVTMHCTRHSLPGSVRSLCVCGQTHTGLCRLCVSGICNSGWCPGIQNQICHRSSAIQPSRSNNQIEFSPSCVAFHGLMAYSRISECGVCLIEFDNLVFINLESLLHSYTLKYTRSAHAYPHWLLGWWGEGEGGNGGF